jgi:hypothetical protein
MKTKEEELEGGEMGGMERRRERDSLETEDKERLY